MMPNMQTTIFGFEQTMQFQIVEKTQVDGDTIETSGAPVPLWFEGSIQPKEPRGLKVTHDGQRSFKRWELYTDLDIKNDAIIKDVNGLIFRVMSKEDWTESGFYKYELTEGVTLNYD